MKNYRGELEGQIIELFNKYLEAYSYRHAKELAEGLAYQSDCYRRRLEIELKRKEAQS